MKGATDKDNGERDRLDANHDSDARGEHRYGDAHQTEAEQATRKERDDLKRALRQQRPSATRYRRLP
jgi:hypothetical protein